jgi:hypothetical protein
MTDIDPYIASYLPAAQLPLVEALREVLVLAENSTVALCPLASWKLDTRDNLHNHEPAVEALMHSSLEETAGSIRSAALLWAHQFDGEVVELPKANRIVVEAQFWVAGILIVIWNSIRPDGECPGCGGPAVGDQVLQHRADSPCTTAADDIAEPTTAAAADAVEPITSAMAFGNSKGWQVVYRQGGVRKSIPQPSKAAAREWIAEHGPRRVPA